MDYERLYSYRFRHVDQASREQVWHEIARYVTEKSLGSPKRLLDPAAGRREFIDAAPAPERWAIDQVAYEHAGSDHDVKFLTSEVMSAELPEAYFDGIFVSNFLEHLGGQEQVYEFLVRMHEVTAKGGRIAILGPNFRYTAKEYFDYADHIVVLTHLAVAEHLHTAGYKVVSNVPRFLPYSFTGRLPASAGLTRAYLNMPFAWRLLGKQFLVVGRALTESPEAAVAKRVVELRAGYAPPDFGHVPDPDAALFLCAVDHKTGYERAHMVGDSGPFEGSELMWAVGLASDLELRAGRLGEITADTIAASFRVDDETVADPERRASLWRELAGAMNERYGGEGHASLAAADRRLAGPGGLLARLAAFEAYEDPLAKKAQLFAKICERRGWLAVDDPENWQVSADNVLMRLALRSGLVEPGDLTRVRAATRDAFKRIAAATAISPPVLDDMLWELGRSNPDLLGSAAGDLREPGRDPSSSWY